MPKPKSTEYPPPLTIPPTSGTHKTTLIILHGRGSTAEKFAHPLLSHPVSRIPTSAADPQAFHSHLPCTKLVFPTASLRRAVAYNRSLTHQWFDMYPLDQYPPEHKEHIQLPGLRESSLYIHGLVQEAVEEVGARNVVVMGLSQGCAAGLASVMVWEGGRLGGFVGMCGWVALRKSMGEHLGGGEEEQEDFFERGEGKEKSRLEQAIEWMKEELDLDWEPRSREQKETRIPPIFLGHGTEDGKVPCELGTLATAFLKDAGVDVRWEEYEGLGHWYSADMLRDVLVFLGELEGWGLDGGVNEDGETGRKDLV